MKNQELDAPQHELNLISALLRDRGVARRQLVDRSRSKLWLESRHFKRRWLGEIYDLLVNGGLMDIHMMLEAHPREDTAQLAVDVVQRRLAARWEGLKNNPRARETVANPAFWPWVRHCVHTLANGSWPSNPNDARHDAYVIVRAAEYPSTTPGVPFDLTQPREGNLVQQLAVVGAVFNKPGRAAKFRYIPSDPDLSPYWLQPHNFGSSLAAEFWDALVTGPDPAIALTEATDATLTQAQRTDAMIRHVLRRLLYSDYHRAAHDPAAAERLRTRVHGAVGRELLKYFSTPNVSPNQDNAHLYAVEYILEPSIAAAVYALAGGVRRDGTADASLDQIALQLMHHKGSLDELKEHLDRAPRTEEVTTTKAPQPESTTREEPTHYAAPDAERHLLRSLVHDPGQLQGGGPVQRLTALNFTLPETTYLFKAIKALPEQSARDEWLVTRTAQKIAFAEDQPELDARQLENILHDGPPGPLDPPAWEIAGDLIALTVRRLSHAAGTVMEAASQESSSPRHVIDRSVSLVQQAIEESLGYSQQSVPAHNGQPTPRASAL